MEASTVLILVTAIGVLVFFLVVARGLMRIDPLLEAVGGEGDSLLAKLRLGLRAIERETSHLPAAAPRINEGLGAVAKGLMTVHGSLEGLFAALRAHADDAERRRL